MSLEKALRSVILAGVFLLPFLALYVSNSMFFPFISGKNFAFRIIIEIILGAWVALALVSPAYRPRWTWLFSAFAAFVILIGISDMFGVYPFKSFWSNYERMEGWIGLAHVFAYFVVAASVLTSEKLWKYWWHTSFAVAILVAFYGLIQLAGLADINQGDVRIDARLGNATYLGVYMLFHIFFAALYWARFWRDSKPGKRFWPSFWYGSMIALFTLILFFTATRGAILGLIGGSLLSAFLVVVSHRGSQAAKWAGIVIAGFLVIAAGFWMIKDQAWVHSIEPLHRLATLGQEGIPDARQMNWAMAWEGFKERPILGWGQENYAAVFDKYYDPGMYAQEQWFDRTHNIVFDWLIAGGILGLLAYLSLYLFALLALWRGNAFLPYERAIITGLLAAYFFYLFFTFDNLLSYILFIALLAYIAVRSTRDMPAQTTIQPLPMNALPVVTGVMVLVTGGLVWVANADAIRANRTLIQAIQSQPEGPTKNLELFREALAYESAGQQEIREQLSQATIGSLQTEGMPNDVKIEFVRLAADELQKQTDESPLSARAPFFLGILLDRAGAYADAKAALDTARARSPHKQGILMELGMNADARGAKDESLAYFKEAFELEPAFNEGRFSYASALIGAGRDAEAEVLLKPLLDAGVAPARRVASAYVAKNRFDKIIALWGAFTAEHKDNLDARVVLASAYYSAGQKDKALEELEAIKRDIPSATAQIDAFIQQVQADSAQ